MRSYEFIANAERLVSIFGYWPSFHDAEVIWIHFDRNGHGNASGPTVEALIHAFEMTNEVDDRGYYVPRNHVLVHLRFSEVADLHLDEFGHQNVLMELSIEDIRNRQLERSNFNVRFAASFGVNAWFQCREVDVAEVRPCDNMGRQVESKSSESGFKDTPPFA